MYNCFLSCGFFFPPNQESKEICSHFCHHPLQFSLMRNDFLQKHISISFQHFVLQRFRLLKGIFIEIVLIDYQRRLEFKQNIKTLTLMDPTYQQRPAPARCLRALRPQGTRKSSLRLYCSLPWLPTPFRRGVLQNEYMSFHFSWIWYFKKLFLKSLFPLGKRKGSTSSLSCTFLLSFKTRRLQRRSCPLFSLTSTTRSQK